MARPYGYAQNAQGEDAYAITHWDHVDGKPSLVTQAQLDKLMLYPKVTDLSSALAASGTDWQLSNAIVREVQLTDTEGYLDIKFKAICSSEQVSNTPVPIAVLSGYQGKPNVIVSINGGYGVTSQRSNVGNVYVGSVTDAALVLGIEYKFGIAASAERMVTAHIPLAY